MCPARARASPRQPACSQKPSLRRVRLQRKAVPALGSTVFQELDSTGTRLPPGKLRGKEEGRERQKAEALPPTVMCAGPKCGHV